MNIDKLDIDYNVKLKETGRLYEVETLRLDECDLIEIVKEHIKKEWNADWHIDKEIDFDSVRISNIEIS